MIAGALEIDFIANIARLQQDMDAAKRAVDSTTRAMAGAADLAKSALLGLGAAFSADAMIEKMRGAIETLADFEDAAKKTGTSVAEISKMQQITAAYGGDFQQVQVGIARMTSQMATSTSAASHAIEALGIKTRDSSGQLRDGGQVFDEVAKKLAQYQDDANKVALVTDLMGKNGAQLLPFLADYAEHIDNVTGVSAEAAAQAKAFEDQIGELKLQSATFTQHLAGEAIPKLSSYIGLLEAVTAETKDTGEKTGILSTAMNGLGVVFESIAVLGVNVKYVFGEIASEVKGLEAQSRAFFTLDWGSIPKIHHQMQQQADADRQAIDKLSQSILNARKDAEAQWNVKNPTNPLLDKRYQAGYDQARASIQYETEQQAKARQAAAQKALADAQRVAKQYNDLIDQIQGKSAGVDPKFYENLSLIATYGAKAGLSLQQIIDLQGQYIKQQPFAIKLEQDKAKAMQAAIDLQLKAAQAQLDVQSKLRAARGLPQSRADIARQYDDQRSLFIAQGNTSALGELNQLINAQAAQSQFQALSQQWQQAMAGMTSALDLLKAKADSGLISQQSYAQAVADLQKQVSPSLAALLPQMQDIAGALGPAAQSTVQQYAAALVRLQHQVDPVISALGNSIESNFGSAFADFVTGTKSASQAFSDMATSILADMAKMEAERAASALIASFIPGFAVANAKGGVYDSPSLSAYSGQIVASPTLFRFATGAGLMGEAGPEAIMPLTRGPDGRLGVQAQGAQAAPQIYVSVDARGTVGVQGGAGNADAQRLAWNIGKAAAREVLAEQMRAGGMLASVGAAR